MKDYGGYDETIELIEKDTERLDFLETDMSTLQHQRNLSNWAMKFQELDVNIEVCRILGRM